MPAASAVVAADLSVPGVRGFATGRGLSTDSGFSVGRFAQWNLASHVGDDPVAVHKNQRLLATYLPNKARLCWLKQQHGITVVPAHTLSHPVEADAVWTDQANTACAVLTADCLPILLAAADGSWVAAVHGGWRGLAAGIIEATLASIDAPLSAFHAWLGPAIGAQAFEVGPDVLELFRRGYGKAVDPFFAPASTDRWLADLIGIASYLLERQGVSKVAGGGQCTFSQPGQFFSYRRDGQTGRMASVIIIEP